MSDTKTFKVWTIMNQIKELEGIMDAIRCAKKRSKKFLKEFKEGFNGYELDHLKNNLDYAKSSLIQIGARLKIDEWFAEAMIEVEKKCEG